MDLEEENIREILTPNEGIETTRAPDVRKLPGSDNQRARLKRKAGHDIGLFRKVRLISRSFPDEDSLEPTYRCMCFRLLNDEWFNEGTGTYNISVSPRVRSCLPLRVQHGILTKFCRVDFLL